MASETFLIKPESFGIDSPLLVAAMHNNAPRVRQVLRDGAPADTRDQSGACAIHFVVRHQDIDDVVSALPLRAIAVALRGALQHRQGHRHSPRARRAHQRAVRRRLHAAPRRGYARCSVGRRRARAPRRALGGRHVVGSTPLHLACVAGTGAAAKALLRGSARVGAVDHFGSTPLHDSCARGHVEAALSLLSFGADTRATNDAGKTPMALAIAGRHVKAVLALMGWGV